MSRGMSVQKVKKNVRLTVIYKRGVEGPREHGATTSRKIEPGIRTWGQKFIRQAKGNIVCLCTHRGKFCK